MHMHSGSSSCHQARDPPCQHHQSRLRLSALLLLLTLLLDVHPTSRWQPGLSLVLLLLGVLTPAPPLLVLAARHMACQAAAAGGGQATAPIHQSDHCHRHRCCVPPPGGALLQLAPGQRGETRCWTLLRCHSAGRTELRAGCVLRRTC